MRKFEYVKPATVAEATGFLAQNAEDTLVLGGGTAAIVMLNLGVLRPRYVLDLAGIDELYDFGNNGALYLGALTTIRELELGEDSGESHPLLREAASQVANVRVRNVATVGGTVAYGEPQTDTPVALTALGATVWVAGANNNRRQVPIAEFYVGPYETVMEQGEIVVGVEVPRPAPGSGGCHLKFTVGSPENKPVANVSALLTIDASSGRCTAARLVLGAVGATPVIAKSADGLVGETPSADRFAEVAVLAAEETDPIEDLRGPVWYKRRIARVLVERALTCALQRTQA